MQRSRCGGEHGLIDQALPLDGTDRVQRARVYQQRCAGSQGLQIDPSASAMPLRAPPPFRARRRHGRG